MKKLISALIFTSFIILGFLSIKQFEFIQFQMFNNRTSSEQLILTIESGDIKKSNIDNLKKLNEVAKELKISIQRTSFERDENGKEKTVYYISSYDYSKYFENMKLKKGDYLTEKSNVNNFLSTIDTGDENQIGKIELFRSFNPIEFRPIASLEKIKNIKGNYEIIGEFNRESLEKILSKNGFSVSINKVDGTSILTPYPYKDLINKGIGILCLLIMLSILYDICNSYKDIAIRYMMGHSFINIELYLARRYVKVLVYPLLSSIVVILAYLYYYNNFQQIFEFLLFWIQSIVKLSLIICAIYIVDTLVITNINIVQSIKNKKPTKIFFYLSLVVRFVVAITIIVSLSEGIGAVKGLRSTYKAMERFDILKDYSYIAGVSVEERGLEKNNEKIRSIYKEFDSNGAFYIYPSYYYGQLSDKENSFPWSQEGERVEINSNYLKVNPIKDINNNLVDISNYRENDLTVLVPEKFKENESEIKNAIENDYKGVYDYKSGETPYLNIVYVKNNQKYFSYSTLMAASSGYLIEDPIALVVNSKFDPVFLHGLMLMGHGYYIKNDSVKEPLKEVGEIIKKHNLEDVLQPVSVAYSNVELSISNNIEFLKLNITYCIVNIFIGLVLLFFATIYYIEMNKQSLALQWVFGYSFFAKHWLVYLTIIVFWSLAFRISLFLFNGSSIVAKISIVFAILDLIVTSVILLIKESKVIKDVIIEK